MSEIKLYRLSTGEDMVGKSVQGNEGENNDHINFEYVEKPFVLIPMQGQPGQPMTIGFHPYIPYTKDTIIKIAKDKIIATTNPDESILSAYQQNTSKIVTKTGPKLIT